MKTTNPRIPIRMTPPMTPPTTPFVAAADSFCLSACSLRMAARSGGVLGLAAGLREFVTELVTLIVGVIEFVGLDEILLVSDIDDVSDLVGDTDHMSDSWFKNKILGGLNRADIEFIDSSTNDGEHGIVAVHLTRPAGPEILG